MKRRKKKRRRKLRESCKFYIVQRTVGLKSNMLEAFVNRRGGSYFLLLGTGSASDHRRQSWGLDGRDPSDFGMGVVGGVGLHEILYPIMYRNMRGNHFQKW